LLKQARDAGIATRVLETLNVAEMEKMLAGLDNQ
jgi:hypothetical protein